jgi:hypothetical protein
MDKSITVNKSKVEEAVKYAVKHVKSWTREELKKLLNTPRSRQDLPLIIQIGNHGYIIGNYAIKQVHDRWHMIYNYSDDTLVFANKHAAIFYAVCNQIGRTAMADEIKNCDEDINRLIVEVDRLKLRLQQAIKRKNSMNIDLYRSRYEQALAQLKTRQFRLEKTLKSAKYINY